MKPLRDQTFTAADPNLVVPSLGHLLDNLPQQSVILVDGHDRDGPAPKTRAGRIFAGEDHTALRRALQDLDRALQPFSLTSLRADMRTATRAPAHLQSFDLHCRMRAIAMTAARYPVLRGTQLQIKAEIEAISRTSPSAFDARVHVIGAGASGKSDCRGDTIPHLTGKASALLAKAVEITLGRWCAASGIQTLTATANLIVGDGKTLDEAMRDTRTTP